MQGTHTWGVAVAVLAALAALLGAAWLALWLLVPSDEDLAAHAAAELQIRLGVPVTLGTLHWRMLPVPAVVLRDLATDQPQAITVQTLTVYPNLAALLERRLQLDRVEVDGAVLPQLSLRTLGLARGGADPDASATPLARLVFRDLSWVSRRGIAVAYDGEIDFDPNWRPRQLQLRRPGALPPTDLALSRQGQEDRWAARIHIGGGTAHGEVRLQTGADGRLQLDGRLQPLGVEVERALAAFNRRSVMAGQASGTTVLSARGASWGQLAQSLHTQTAFKLGRSTLLRFDLDKAVRSLGKEHGGQTALDSVTGQLDTQNTAQGMVVSYTGVQARSGALSASGHARIADRQVDAELAVDLVDGVVGVPLRLSGPLDQVQVSVPGGAVAGAVLGTAVLPGVGTAIGARLGATLGKIFKPEPVRKPP
jgi:uncharacterized protein involved in outer membrane biogenesis